MFISNIIISAVGMVGYCLATVLIKYLGARNIQSKLNNIRNI